MPLSKIMDHEQYIILHQTLNFLDEQRYLEQTNKC
jgi:hypothetical protein